MLPHTHTHLQRRIPYICLSPSWCVMCFSSVEHLAIFLSTALLAFDVGRFWVVIAYAWWHIWYSYVQLCGPSFSWCEKSFVVGFARTLPQILWFFGFSCSSYCKSILTNKPITNQILAYKTLYVQCIMHSFSVIFLRQQPMILIN